MLIYDGSWEDARISSAHCILEESQGEERIHEQDKKGAGIDGSLRRIFAAGYYQVTEKTPIGVARLTPTAVGVLTLTMGAACGRGLNRFGKS